MSARRLHGRRYVWLVLRPFRYGRPEAYWTRKGAEESIACAKSDPTAWMIVRAVLGKTGVRVR